MCLCLFILTDALACGDSNHTSQVTVISQQLGVKRAARGGQNEVAVDYEAGQRIINQSQQNASKQNYFQFLLVTLLFFKLVFISTLSMQQKKINAGNVS